jgi:ATP-binding cassette, subfamily C, bacterial CydC
MRSDPLVQAIALLRPRPARLLLAIACGVLSLGSALGLAGVSAWLITRAWQMPPVLDLSIAVVAVRALGISRGVLHYCERLASHDTALRSAGSARAAMYQRLAYAPATRAARLSGGDLAGRFGSDVDELAEVLTRAVLPIAVAAVLSAAAATTILLISPPAAAVLAACLLVAGVIGPWLSARGAAAQERLARHQHSERDVATMLALDHAPELAVGGRLAAVIEDAEDRQRRWSYALDLAAIPAAFGAAMPVATVGISVLGAVVAVFALPATTAPMTVAVLMLLPLSAFEATGALPRAATQLTRSRIAARRLLDLVDGEPARQRQTRQRLGADLTLRAERLSTGRARVVGAGLDLVLQRGARLAVTGPSGAGKTTLLMTLAGLLTPRHGRVTLGGIPIRSLDERQLRSSISFFAEDAHVFATTVRDNLLVVRGDSTDAEITEALARVGLGTWLSGLPDGLATVLTGGAAAISAGQRRRLLLARALLSRATLLLFDEPAEHLSGRDADDVVRRLLTPGGFFGADRTIVVATHIVPDQVTCPRLRITPAG